MCLWPWQAATKMRGPTGRARKTHRVGVCANRRVVIQCCGSSRSERKDHKRSCYVRYTVKKRVQHGVQCTKRYVFCFLCANTRYNIINVKNSCVYVQSVLVTCAMNIRGYRISSINPFLFLLLLSFLFYRCLNFIGVGANYHLSISTRRAIKNRKRFARALTI